jgi:phosphoribosyl-ATP pyrophosphohydrolase/phosphoribosyl-AMP cyclohydrolase/histidinol dehydrogenase
MIVPKVSVSANPMSADQQEELVSKLKHWGFLGSAYLVVEGESCDEFAAPLSAVIKKVSGFCDLLIRFDSASDDAAIEMLNIGANSLVVGSASQTEQWPTVPSDRIQLDSDLTDVYCIENLKSNPDIIADFLIARLKSDRPDGMWPTVICDQLGIALGLAYSNETSLRHAIATRNGTYWSRSRNELWEKGATSGATQQLLGIRLDCDSDCLRFTVTQDPPGFCHKKTHTCFGEERSIATVLQRLAGRIESSNEKSFTRRLATDAALLEKKLLEEAKELSDASQEDDRYEVAWETADVFYFSLVAMLKNGVGLDEVYAELARRMNRVIRRD